MKSERVSIVALSSPFLLLTACGSSASTTPQETGSGAKGATATDGAPLFPKSALPKDLLATLPLVAPTSDLDTPVFSGIVDVGPGEDVTFCTFTDVVLDEATIFAESYGAESPFGHHSILQYTNTPQDPHTGDCGTMDGQMLLGGSGGKNVADKPTLPKNFGVEVPAGTQLVINHHWINTSDQTVQGQAMMLARKLPRGGDTVLAGSLPMLGLGWEIPAADKLTYSTECTFPEDVSYVLALGHMHEYGQHVSVDVKRTAGGKIFTLDDPYEIKKGDTVRLTCDWANPTAAPIGFPREMCIFFGYTIGSSFVCANGTWLSPQAAQAAGTGMGTIASHL